MRVAQSKYHWKLFRIVRLGGLLERNLFAKLSRPLALIDARASAGRAATSNGVPASTKRPIRGWPPSRAAAPILLHHCSRATAQPTRPTDSRCGPTRFRLEQGAKRNSKSRKDRVHVRISS